MNIAPNQAKTWHCGRFRFAVTANEPVLVMGIINVTPDSFSDGGKFLSADAALVHAEQLLSEGAQILDLGGESTRPGAAEVSVADEIARVVPIVDALAKAGHCVSIDTRKPQVMRAAIDAGAAIVNDVYALRAAGAIEVCAASDVGVVLMHMQGEPATMQHEPRYNDVAKDVGEFLLSRAQACESAGIARERIAIDPGFGFGKTTAHNVELTRRFNELTHLGYPLLAGWSRKRTIGEITGRTIASERVQGSVAAALACVARGARIVRVHDVRETVDALKVWQSMGIP
ncbi:MAG: dihydropteroate synthase [Casimicrobium sp.]